MAKVNANYEAMLIINPAVGEEAIAAVVERFKALIEKNGTLAEVDEWGTAVWRMRSTTSTRATMC